MNNFEYFDFDKIAIQIKIIMKEYLKKEFNNDKAAILSGQATISLIISAYSLYDVIKLFPDTLDEEIQVFSDSLLELVKELRKTK